MLNKPHDVALSHQARAALHGDESSETLLWSLRVHQAFFLVRKLVEVQRGLRNKTRDLPESLNTEPSVSFQVVRAKSRALKISACRAQGS